MARDLKNPLLQVKTPKVVLDPLAPISIQEVGSLINTCPRGDFIGERDRALFLFLLDTGARAREACNMNIKEIDLNSGVDIFVLQRLMGHADLPILRRYLAQNDEDNQLAYMHGSPVDNNF